MTATTTRKEPLNVVCAGLGRIGARHAQNIAHRTPHAQVIGVFDADPSKEQWTQENLPVGVTFTRSYDELISLPNVNLVWIATPTPFHAEQIIKALDKDIHVFCEKPISLDAATAEKVVQGAKQKPNLYVSIGFLRRFDSAFQIAHSRIQDGAVGEPRVLRTTACDPIDETGHFENVYAPASGGIFVDCAVHDIDCTLWMLGEDQKIASVFATGTTNTFPKLKEYGDADTVIGVVTFKSGIMAEFYCSRISRSGQQSLMEVIGTNGKLSVAPAGAASKVTLSDSVSTKRDGGVGLPDYYDLYEDAMRREPELVVKDILNGRKPRMTLDSSVNGLKIGQALQESLRTGKVVAVD